MEPSLTYEEIGEQLRMTDEVQSGKMFGMPCLKIGGKAFAGFYQDNMILKLRGNVLKEALDLDGVNHFDPMGGRPMKEWVQVPFSQVSHWQALAKHALSLQREANG